MFEELLSLHGLSLDRLRNFLAFADAGSIVRAADGEPVRQALYSRQIRELEEFFGVELVRRQGRGLVLTDAGRQLATMTRAQFGALEEFKRGAKELPLKLGIVAPNSIATWLLLPRLGALRRALPRHEFAIEHEQTAGIIRSVLEGRHDLGFVRDTPLPRTLGRKAAGWSVFALFVPKALAKGLDLTKPGDWLRLPLALPIGGAIRESVDRLAASHGVELKPVLTCDSYLQAAAAVASGAVASILPDIAAPHLAGRNIEMVAVPELNTRRYRILMIWSKRAAATRSSVAAAVETIPKLLTGDQ